MPVNISSINPRGLCRKLERTIGFLFRDLYNFNTIDNAKLLSKVNHLVKPKYTNDPTWLRAVVSSVRKCYLTQHCIQHHRLVRNKATVSKIVRDIKAGKCILEMSHRYKFNPIGLVKVYTDHFSLPNAAMKRPPLKHPAEKAYKVDIFRPNKDVLANSQRYEAHVEQWLQGNGIAYYTQDQLIAKNSKLTPDFLLKRPIVINATTVHWLDAKNFYGATVPYIVRSLKKQGAKYNKAFGNGGFVFSLGFTDELSIPDCLVLDDVDGWSVV